MYEVCWERVGANLEAVQLKVWPPTPLCHLCVYSPLQMVSVPLFKQAIIVDGPPHCRQQLSPIVVCIQPRTNLNNHHVKAMQPELDVCTTVQGSASVLLQCFSGL